MDGTNIFFIIVIVLLLIAAVVFLILWLAKGGTQKNQKKELSITGLKFNYTTTSVTATWDNVGNPNDVVTLYADINPINFNAEGKPEVSSSPGTQVVSQVLASSPVSGTSKTVTLTGLKENTKYYVDLVVTNPNFVGFNPNPDIIFTSETIPTSNFLIQEINTIGAIALNVNDQTKVYYQTGVNKSDINDIWTYDATNFTISTRGLGANSSSRPTLYNNNGVLAAKNATSATDPSSQWTYNINGNNRWCIKGTTTCMNLASPVNNSPILLTENSTTKFVNIPVSI